MELFDRPFLHWLTGFTYYLLRAFIPRIIFSPNVFRHFHCKLSSSNKREIINAENLKLSNEKI